MGNHICIAKIHYSTTCFFFTFKSADNPRKYVDALYYRLSQFYNYCKYHFFFWIRHISFKCTNVHFFDLMVMI